MQRAYALFGDEVSYDPTYGTNKYNMTFTPFTGIDHHKRSITFACALIEHENDESFMWIFDRFLAAMGGKEPNYIITDEDPGIIKASSRNVPMGGLLRTTQRSESANSFFKRFENKYGTLTEFLVRYESATDHQKHLLKLREEENANSILETLCMGQNGRHKRLVGYTHLRSVTNFEVSLVEDAKKGLKFAVECGRSTNDVRWSKNALRSDVYDWNGNLKEESDVREFAKLIKEFRTKLEGNTQPLTKQQQIKLLLGCKVLEETNILPPNVSRNKGCGKRLVSKKNKAIKKAEKAKRLCANCKRKGNHDKRNCPYDFARPSSGESGELADEEVEEEGDEDEE
ncbi:uncharacterized protein LOC141631210 [Silene latifolia]|uniref:uncharacterized protein LOC141631210 n=1 Tax=Silene latifolia TaxID=37657 RepID=UPI003D785D16